MQFGTGGLQNGPALFILLRMGIPTFIQEQNSLLGKPIFSMLKSKTVFTAYPNMEKFFTERKRYFCRKSYQKNIITDIIDNDLAKEKLGLEKGN